MTVAQALSAERERQGLSLLAIAVASGTSASRIKSVLEGETPNPGFLTVAAILAALGKSLTWLDRELKK
jgi:transcriptional regulator with XRE-family HTH domain